MKHVIVLYFILSGLACEAQTIQDFFEDKAGAVTWLGIDYSHVKLVGEYTQFKDAGPIGPAEIRDKYFPGWNSLVLTEASKYDIKGMFMLSALTPDISMVTILNSATDADKIKDGTVNKFSCRDITKFVGSYPLKGNEGLGIVIIADLLDKGSETAAYFVVVFNLNTRDVLLCENVIEKAGGIGMRNYWAGSLYNLVKDVKKNLYWSWKGKYDK
ncbi:MAG: hypothetical protein NTU51_09105 [Bacteroidetes bacterium]|nr:hypothetical protein [Bacteroidota bacterium]